jgi:hypothetical protein
MSGAAGLEMDSALPLLIAIGAAVACFAYLVGRVFTPLNSKQPSKEAEAIVLGKPIAPAPLPHLFC